MKHSIRDLEQKMRESKGLESLLRRIGLFFSYIFFGVYHAIHVLFSPSQRSFEAVSTQNEHGVWQQSFQDHVGYKQSARVFSVTTPVAVVVAAVMLFSIMQILFPTGIAQVYAATNVFPVTNNLDAGPGSLRDAITNANAALATDENIIRLDFSTPNQPVQLLSQLPVLNKPVKIQNPNGSVIFIIDGQNLGPANACLDFGPGSSNSEISGLAIQGCPGNGIVLSGALTGIKVGSSSGADKDHVYISGVGDNGVKVDAAVQSTTIQNVTIGLNQNGAAGAVAQDGIEIEGDGNTISDVLIGNSFHGISISGINNTVTGSYIGVKQDGGAIGNQQDGLDIFTSGPNTIGGTTLDSANVIGFNGNDGIEFRDNANNALVQFNFIGTSPDGAADYGNGRHGVIVRDTTGVTIGSEAGAYTTLIANNTQEGVHIDNADGTELHNARVYSNSNHGIFAKVSDNLLFNELEVYSNTRDGINVQELLDAVVQASYIGTREGGGDLGNGFDGMHIDGSTNVRIGVALTGGNTAHANSFSFNNNSGVTIDAGSTGVAVSQNTFVGNTSFPLTNLGGSPVVNILSAEEGGDITGDNAPDGGYIEIYRNGLFLGQQQISAGDGSWTISTLGDTINEGDEIEAIWIDDNNHTTPFSNTFTVTAPDDGDDGGDDGDDPAPGVEIDEVSVDAGVTAADISVTTSRTSTVSVAYGRSTADLNDTATSETLATTHTLALIELQSGTNYVARVTVTDTDDNTATQDVTFKTRSIDSSYLSNAYVDGQKVYDTGDVFYVDPSGTKIRINDANNDHEVRLTLTDEDNNEHTAANEWKDVSNGTVTQTIKDLDSGTEYDLEGSVREDGDEKTETAAVDIATVIASAAAPTITSLSGEYTVTTQPQKLQFSGSASTGQFRFQNVETGDIVATCPLDAEGICELPFALSLGEYNVLHESLSAGIPSAPDMHRLVVTYPRVVSALNTDAASTAYTDRIVTNSSIKVVGLGPAGATGTVYINGTSVGTVTYTADVVWEKTVDLAGAGVARGSDFLVEVQFVDSSGDRVYANDVYYPAHFAFVPVTPALGTLAAEYVRSAQFNTTVTGGAGDTVRVFVNGDLFHATALPDSDSGISAVEVPVYTAATGAVAYKVENENSIGLKSSATANYTVVSGTTTTTEEPSTDTTTDADTEESATDTDTDTEEPTTDVEEPATGEEPTGETDTEEPAETIEPISADEDLTVIPEEYRTVVTDQEEVTEIKQDLEEKNVDTLKIEAVRVTRDQATGRLVTEVVEPNQQGEQILRSTKQNGLPAIEIPFFQSADSQEHISFSGVTEPYALVRLEVHSDPIVQVARADENGKWTMTVNVDDLPEGSHTAYLQTESRGVESDQIEIAKFVVVEERSLSNTTWIFIVNISIVVLVLLAWLVAQVRKKQTGSAAVAGGGNMTVVLPSSAEEVEEAVDADEKKEEDEKKDDDDQNFHSALGV